MIDFLIKSSASLVALLLFYHLLLENEKMHQFNRFYLLFSLVFSLIIPFVTIEIIKEIPKQTMQYVDNLQATPLFIEETTNYLSLLLWTLYFVITLAFTFRFAKNIIQFRTKRKSNIIVAYQNAKLVLVKEKTLPHTFWNTIFINEIDYKNRNIEEELYTHELTHVNQKHTLDVLFVEILKTVFWFNPLFVFYKKAIQLNHEFLADQKVVTAYNNVPFYQNLLLEKAKGNQTIYLASNLNYLVTKKRLIMMTKSTSKPIAFLKKIAVTPILVGLVFFICSETVAQETQMTNSGNSKKTNGNPDIEKYFENTVFKIKDKKGNLVSQKKFSELTEKEKTKIPPPPPPSVIPPKKTPTKAELEGLLNRAKFALWIDNNPVDNSELNKYNSMDFVLLNGSFVHKNARSKKFPQEYQMNLYTAKGYEKAFLSNNQIHPKVIEWTIEEENETKQQAEINLNSETSKNVDSLTEKPEFEGGITAFFKYVGKNYKIPEEAQKNKVNGKIFVNFIIETDGTLSNIKILRDLGYGTGEEAVKVLKNSPKWKPGSLDGQPVRVNYNLPISISSN